METTMTATRIDRGSTADHDHLLGGRRSRLRAHLRRPARAGLEGLHRSRPIVPRWWGPHGTTTTVVEMDVRPGGKWRYVSSAPDREDVEFYGEYLEVDPPSGFKWTFMFDVEGVGPQGGPETHHVRGPRRDGRRSPRSATWARPRCIEGALATGMAKGAIETWDRLEALLAEG